MWLRIESSGGLFMNIRFHKRREISWQAEQLVASQEGLWSIELVMSSFVHEV
jgi:hypothetical protein